jgi:hypothetical protein
MGEFNSSLMRLSPSQLCSRNAGFSQFDPDQRALVFASIG